MRRPTPAYALSIGEERPIADLNMTPLIDVLLVLIVILQAVTHIYLPMLAHERKSTLFPNPSNPNRVTPTRLTVASTRSARS